MAWAMGRDEVYANKWEYLEDELKRLDLLIHIQVLHQKHQNSNNPLDQWMGLVISDEEIEGLLDADSRQTAGAEAIHFNKMLLGPLLNDLEKLEISIKKKRACSLQQGMSLPLIKLSSIYALTGFEERCILICLAPALQRKYDKYYAYLQNDVTCKKPSIDLLLKLLCSNPEERIRARKYFSAQAPLFKHRLMQMEGGLDSDIPLLSRELFLDERMVDFLLGAESFDHRLSAAAKLLFPSVEQIPVALAGEKQKRLQQMVNTHFNQREFPRESMVFYFYGPAGSGKREVAAKLCADLGVPLISADMEKIWKGSREPEEIMDLLIREVKLRQAALCLENFQCLLDDLERCKWFITSISQSVSNAVPLIFLLGSRIWEPQDVFQEDFYVNVEFPFPAAEESLKTWQTLCQTYELGSDVDFKVLTGKFCLAPGQIRQALKRANDLTRWSGSEDERISMALLHKACSAQLNHNMGSLTQKMTPSYGFTDIILPPLQMDKLKELCNQVKHRSLVYEEWGFGAKLSAGKGFNALFTGPPGTGKSMAAEVIARELELDLYRIELSDVVSKYIGETEKNLEKIFREAQASCAILFFDEADALFGKRSEVKDAHDRYANIEVAYLLQKMEEYRGISILATNLRSNMDEAFVRRLQFTVEFPFPDAAYRRQIWQAVFPPQTPRHHDIDYNYLADQFELTGGNIKNIVLRAAFFAAEDAEIVTMEHITRAVHRELQKMGKNFIADAMAASP